MKNIYLLILLVGFLAFSACSVDEKPFQELLPQGSLISVGDVQTGFFNLASPDAASIGFTLEGIGELVSDVNIYKSFNGGTPVEFASGVAAPSSFTVTLAEAISGLGVSVEDLEPGDNITFSFGEVATASGIYTSGTTLVVPISCPSNLGGTYTVVSTGTSTDDCCPDEVTVTSTVVLTDNGGGKYGMSDFSGGLYFAWYDVYGMTMDGSAGDIEDICNAITLTTSTEPYGESLTGMGTVNANTGVISFAWSNGYGDQGTSVLTPE